MEFVPYRLLRNQPGELRKRLTQEGQLVITLEGKPLALMVSVDPGRLDELVQLVSRLRAQLAVSEMREQARRRGIDRLKPQELQAEIRTVRRTRRA
ncbi:MAG: prevent-host-death protein [Anaerolineales bacterium]|jgi:hypothetical protein